MCRLSAIPIVLIAGIAILGCDSWVENVETPGTVIYDGQLTREDQIEPLINGVVSRFGMAHAGLALASSVLSDELFFDEWNAGSRTPDLHEIDQGLISLRNGLVTEHFRDVGRLRFLADDLVRRVEGIDFKSPDLRRKALFTGYFYGAIARFYLAAYFGLTERQGGGVITEDPTNPGSFTPSDEMYALALEKLALALTVADDYNLRIANTLAARIHLMLGDVNAARDAADGGMHPGDPPFASFHDPMRANTFWESAGPDAPELLVNPVYKEYVDADTAEDDRLPLAEIVSSDSTTTFYRQDRYKMFSDPIWFSTWQENELMLAELDVLDGNRPGALAHVNAVRRSHGLENLTDVDLEVVEMERRKELWLMGLRLLDERRFGTWHLGESTWWNLPIPQFEWDDNPNL